MIKITYETWEAKTTKPERTEVNIFDGRVFVRYNIKGKANQIVTQMRQDGKKGILFSRGAMLQMFAGKKEKEILEIVKKDIVNGVYVAEKKTKKKLEIKNMVVTEK